MRGGPVEENPVTMPLEELGAVWEHGSWIMRHEDSMGGAYMFIGITYSLMVMQEGLFRLSSLLLLAYKFPTIFSLVSKSSRLPLNPCKFPYPWCSYCSIYYFHHCGRFPICVHKRVSGLHPQRNAPSQTSPACKQRSTILNLTTFTVLTLHKTLTHLHPTLTS